MKSEILFFLFAASILISAVLTVTTRRILRAAVYLLFVLVSTAGLYFMLNYNFLAASQLTVYAGGIIVLIIFSILLTSHISERARMATRSQGLLSALATGAGAILTILTILNYDFVPSSGTPVASNVHEVGRALVSYKENGFALPFEVISILLVAAMVGAIVVARKEGDTTIKKTDNPENTTRYDR